MTGALARLVALCPQCCCDDVCDMFILSSLQYSILFVDPPTRLCLVPQFTGATIHSSPTGPHVAPLPRTPQTPACPHLPRAPARALPCLSPCTHVVSANAHIRTQQTCSRPAHSSRALPRARSCAPPCAAGTLSTDSTSPATSRLAHWSDVMCPARRRTATSRKPG